MRHANLSSGSLMHNEVFTYPRSELDDLRKEALHVLLPGVAAGVYLLIAIMVTVAVRHDDVLEVWAFGATLWGTCLLSYLTLRRDARSSSLVLVTGLAMCLWAAIHLFPFSLFGCGFSLVVVIAGLLLGPRYGLMTATVSSAILLHSLWGARLASSEATTTALFLVWSSAFLSWLTSRPLFDAINWSWSAYDQAWRKTLEARLRQAEMVKLSDNLSEAYSRLEALNGRLREAREIAEEARQLKAQFAASISHELRTPLNLIIGFSEMMVLAPHTYRSERLPERYRGDVEAIYRNASHLSELIDDILELSQIEANRLGLEKGLSSLSEIVAEAVAAVSSLFKDKGLFLVTHIPDDLPLVYVDRTRIREVLINLLNNASRFTEEGGVRVSAEKNGREVVISVADTGVGISAEDLPKVFHEFYQLRNPERSHQGGSGLGLAIAKRFVELHGGSIWAESQPGVGTTFLRERADRSALPQPEDIAATVRHVLSLPPRVLR